MAHGAVRFLFWALEAIVLALLLAVAALAWRLSQGPISLDPLAPYIASAIADSDSQLQFQLDHARLRWEDLRSSPVLIVENVRVLDAAGGAIAALPSMVVQLNLSQLLRGEVAADHIGLSNPILRFVRRADGSISLGTELSAAPESEEAPSTESGNAIAAWLIDALTQPGSTDNRAGYLNTVTIDDTTLILVDERSGSRWLVPDANLSLERQDGDVQLTASMPLITDGRQTTFNAKGRYVAASSRLLLDIDVEEFQPARIAELAPQLAPLETMNLLLSGDFNAALTLANGAARLNWLQFDVKGKAGSVRLPSPVNHEYAIKSLDLRGAAGAAFDRIVIDRLHIALAQGDADGPVISGAAVGNDLNGQPSVEVNLAISDMSLDTLKGLWPAEVKRNTGEWIRRNLNNGGLKETQIKLALAGPDLAGLDVTDLSITSQLSGVTVNYIKGLPQVQDTAGTLNVGLKEVVIDLSHGRIPDPISGNDLAITGGRLRMHGLGSGVEMADFDINIAADLPDVLRLIDHEPLGYAKTMGITPEGTQGRANIVLALDFPLVADLKLDQLEIGVKAEVSDTAIPHAAFGLDLTDGQMRMALTAKGMDVDGTASLGGIIAAIKWRENFGGGEFRSRYVLDAVIANDQRPLVSLGMAPFTPPYIDGPVTAHVTYTINRDKTATLEADADLMHAAMAVPELGWRKDVGQPAQGYASVTLREGRLENVTSFRVQSGDDLDVAGAAVFADGARMASLKIDKALIGETQLAGRLLIDEAGAYDLEVAGPSFNSTYFWKELNRDEARGQGEVVEDEAPKRPIRIKASVDRMWLTKVGDFRNVELTYARERDGIRAIDFKSVIDGADPFTFTLTSVDGHRSFKGESANGGGVVRAIGLFDDIIGGKLEITGEVERNGAVEGTAEITEFKLVEAPLVARLLSVAALTGIVDELQGQGISFSTLRVPFTFAKSTLKIKDGEMYATSLGLTGSGTYNSQTSQIDIDGTLVPVYALNSMLSNIPLVGLILSGGEKGSGIFAATYSYRGDVATAEPTVNPLAALAPGITRRIFDIFKGRPSPPPRAPKDISETEGSGTPPQAN